MMKNKLLKKIEKNIIKKTSMSFTDAFTRLTSWSERTVTVMTKMIVPTIDTITYHRMKIGFFYKNKINGNLCMSHINIYFLFVISYTFEIPNSNITLIKMFMRPIGM